MAEMTIGALARAAGVGVETVRYYQRRGLLAEPLRPIGGVRRYGADAVTRLGFIRRALTELIQRCDAGKARRCPIIDSLARGS